MQLTVKHYKAAKLLAEGELTLAQIAERVGVGYTIIASLKDGWRSRPEFMALVEQYGNTHLQEARTRVRRRAASIIARLFADMEDSDPRIRIAAARELREWIKEPDKPLSVTQVTHVETSGNRTLEDCARAAEKQRGLDPLLFPKRN